MNLKEKFDIFIRKKHRSKFQLALVLGLGALSLLFLWQLVHWWIIIIAILAALNLAAVISYQKDLAVPFLETLLAKEYLRLKAKPITQPALFWLAKRYQSILTYLLILFLDSQKSFELFIQGEVPVDVKFDAGREILKIKSGDADIKKCSAKELLDFYRAKLTDHPELLVPDLCALYLESKKTNEFAKPNEWSVEEFFDLYKLKKKKIISFSLGASAGIILSIILLVFIIPSWHKLNAYTYGWVQTSWTEGASTTSVAVHPGDKTNWLKYFSAGLNLFAGTSISLTTASSSTLDTADIDFQSGTSTNAYIADGKIIMLKPTGATCATSTECANNYCSDNICFNCGVDTVQYEGGPYDANGVSTSTGGYYRTVLIGTQCWLKDNLNVGTMIGAKLADNTTVQNQTNNSTIEKYCYGYIQQDNASQIDTGAANCAIYGGFYQVPEALEYNGGITLTTGTVSSGVIQGICPTGWHVPSDVEFVTLSTYLGGDSVAGGHIKEVGTTHWWSPNTGADNSSGFTGLAGGYHQNNGTFYGSSIHFYIMAKYGWGSTSFLRIMTNESTAFTWASGNRASGLNVRCIKGF